jgi:hypothetical protein
MSCRQKRTDQRKDSADQGGDVVDGVEVLGDPEEGVEIAQAALALLDVGLEGVAGIAHAAVALVAFGELGLGEGEAGAGDDLLGVAPPQLLIERLLAADVAGLQQVGADGEVGLGLAQALVDRAGGVADLQAEIPEVIEDVFDHLLAVGGELVGQQEQDIDIRLGRQLAPAIAADGDDRQPLGRRRISQWVRMSRGKIMQCAQQLIDEEAELPGRQAAVAVGVEAAADVRAAGSQGGLQLGQHGGALLGRRPRSLGDRREAPGERAPVDDGTLVADGVHERSTAPQAVRNAGQSRRERG